MGAGSCATSSRETSSGTQPFCSAASPSWCSSSRWYSDRGKRMTFDQWLLSLVVFLPLVGAGVIAAMPKGQQALVRLVALIASGAALVFGIVALVRFDFHARRSVQFSVHT